MIQLLNSYESHNGDSFYSDYEKVDKLTVRVGERHQDRVLTDIVPHVLGYTLHWKELKDGVIDYDDKAFIVKNKIIPLDADEYFIMKKGMDLRQQRDFDKYIEEYKKNK